MEKPDENEKINNSLDYILINYIRISIFAGLRLS
jgi:hypothetical protein